MPQDAYTIKFIAEELENLLVGGKISKITQPEKDTLTFIIYTRKGSVKLEMCLSAKYCRLNIAKGEVFAPKIAPSFCMLLRKHLQNAEITDVKQIEHERIVYFDFNCFSEFERTRMRLYAELMGKYSNAVLTKDGKIVGALKTTSLTDSVKRILFNGAAYTLPEKQDKIDPDDMQALAAAFESAPQDKAEFISSRVRGISYATALDIASTYGQNLTAKELNSYICGGQCSPCVTYSDGEPDDFKARSCSEFRRDYPDILSAQSAYYAYVCGKKAFTDRKRKIESALRSAVKKHEKRLAADIERLDACADSESVRLKGELLTANLYAVKRGDTSFEAVNYYDPEGGRIKIELDKSLSPADNAQKFYRRYAKLKRTYAAVSEQKREAERELNYLASIQAHIDSAESLIDLEETEKELVSLGILKGEPTKGKTKDTPAPFRAFEKDGFRILAGRNNLSNDRLLKSISPDDMWLHTQVYHSAHVAILAQGREIPESVLIAAAEICANFSDGRGGGKVPVDYCRRKFVKKPQKAAAGFVVYTDYKTVLVAPNAHAELAENEKPV